MNELPTHIAHMLWNSVALRAGLTENKDAVSVGSISPNDGWNGHHVVAEVIEDVDVLPVIERVRCLRLRPLHKPGRADNIRKGGWTLWPSSVHSCSSLCVRASIIITTDAQSVLRSWNNLLGLARESNTLKSCGTKLDTDNEPLWTMPVLVSLLPGVKDRMNM